MKLKPQEKYLILLIRDIRFGEVKIKIESGLPRRVIRYEKSIMLEDVIKVEKIKPLDCGETKES